MIIPEKWAMILKAYGDFINRMKKKGVTEEALTERIKNNLKLSGYDVTGYPNSKTFPVGTIATIEQSGVVYYLLAMSTFDDLNRAHCTNEELGVAIEKLLDYYDVHGQGSILYLPLLGTGLSRTGLSDRASYNIILEGIETLFQNTSVLPVYKIMVCICPHISGLDGQSSGTTKK